MTLLSIISTLILCIAFFVAGWNFKILHLKAKQIERTYETRMTVKYDTYMIPFNCDHYSIEIDDSELYIDANLN